MRILMVTTMCVLFCLAAIDAKPDRPRQKEEPKAKKIPSLEMNSNWGVIKQKGREFVIYGHPTWSAFGEILPNGKILVVWELNDTGRRGPGIYEIQPDGSLKGTWNYGTEVELDREKGLLIGPQLSDSIYRVEVE